MEFTLQTIQGVPQYPLDEPISNAYLKNLKDMRIGAGIEQFSAGKDGIFLGAETFDDAPFSVDMEGNLTAESGTFTGVITASSGSSVSFADITAGTNSNALNVGAGNVKIDGANKRIIINDGTNDRVLIGYLLGKF